MGYENIPFTLHDGEEVRQIYEYSEYFISNNGRVFSNKNKYKCRNGWRELKPFYRNGYLYITLCNNGKNKKYAVHRLVGMHFCENYKEGLVINHIDANKSNNYYKNLEWITQKNNIRASYKTSNYNATRNYCLLTLLDENNNILFECKGRKKLSDYISSNNIDASALSLFAYGISRKYRLIKRDKNGNKTPFYHM